MIYLLLFGVICLLLAAVPDTAWRGLAPGVVVAGLYLLSLLMARWSRLAAWQQKIIVGAERIDLGFFGDDGSYYVPTYQDQETWQGLLAGLPLAALLIFRLVRRAHNAPVRRCLKWLFFFYGVAALYGSENGWFPGPVARPAFGNPALTAPPPAGAPASAYPSN
ncbi:hypothetical protein [Hymenobacter daeguensis]